MPQAYKASTTEEALRQILEIGDYIAVDSRANARKMVEQIHSAISSLAIFPHRYNVFESNTDSAKTVRSMPVRPFIVYYRIIEQTKTVEILSVRHGARDEPPRFFG